MAARDITGMRFGRLRVTGQSAPRRVVVQLRDYWECVCDCGATKSISIDNLIHGRTNSCGCLRREVMRRKQTTHGCSKERLYHIWKLMLRRCSQPSDRVYRWYGGRGIAVCERWKDYANFKADMGDSHDAHLAKYGSRNTTIDRIDNEGNYDPGNCRWATMAQQRANQSAPYSRMVARVA